MMTALALAALSLAPFVLGPWHPATGAVWALLWCGGVWLVVLT